MKSLLKYGLATVLFSTTLSFAQAAFASFPGSIAGTNWKGMAHKEPVIVTISEQLPKDSSQDTNCFNISGFMTPFSGSGAKDIINGFYCPDGTFAFSRFRNDDHALMQVYSGSLTSDGNSMKGNFLYMSGNWGKYNFSASK